MMATFEPLKMPEKDFDIFKPSKPHDLNACLNFMHDMSYGYIEGYRYAAEVLFEQVQNCGELDTLIYPIMFLIRQHFELRLKQILKTLYIIGERKSEPEFTHNLSRLWRQCEPNLTKYTSREDRAWFKQINILMEQITSVDPGADAFRFMTSKSGEKNLSGISHINLVHLFSVVTPVMDWLEGIDSFLAEIKSLNSELM